MFLNVPISKMRNIIYFDYIEYNPFVLTVRQYMRDRETVYKKSELYKYYNNFVPLNASQALFESNEIYSFVNTSKFILRHPFHTFVIRGEKKLHIKHGCQYFGKVSAVKGELEFNRLINLYRSIKAYGYKKGNPVNGYLLKRGNDYRFIVTGGNHRTAVLSALKYKKIKVRVKNEKPFTLENILKNLDSEKIHEDEARKMFNRFFDDTGKNKKEGIDSMGNSKKYQPAAAIQKWRLIEKCLDNTDKTLLDIGCNYGYLVEKATRRGMRAIGYEANINYTNVAKKVYYNKLTPEKINLIENYDVILLLSVSHQWNTIYDKETELKMIQTLGYKSNKFFFQPASINSKYKESHDFKDNDGNSIVNYNFNMLKKLFPKKEVKYIGKTELTTEHEKFRYIFLVEDGGSK